MKKIGITQEQCKIGTKVNYYYFYDEKTGEYSEPKETVILSEPYEMCGSLMCSVDKVSGVVPLTHLEIIY